MLLRASRDADPAFYAAHSEYIRLMRQVGRRLEVEREYPMAVSDALSACLAIIARTPSAYGAIIAWQLLDAQRRHGAHPCFETALIGSAALHAPATSVNALELRYASAATRYAPEVPHHWVRHAASLHALHRGEEAVAILERGVRHAGHAIARMQVLFALASLHEQRGDSARAAQLKREVRHAVHRDRRPGVEMAWLDEMAGPRTGEPADAWLQRSRRQLALARRARSWSHEYATLMGRGSVMLDAGQAIGAIAAFDTAIAAIPREFARELTPLLRWRRGRAFAKAGRLADAERDLRWAIGALADRHEPYLTAELHHNLAHVYESSARWPEAVDQADRFVRSAEPMRTDAMRMMSRRDAGVIRWKAGLHAEARKSFDAMVRVIDERRQNYFYAGEYFERTGRMHRAIAYYRLGAASDAGEISLNLAGLTRAFEALGMTDSARATAVKHDRHIQSPNDLPLLPAVLAREGRSNEALGLLREWLATQRSGGNLVGQAMTSLAIANILLEAGQPGEALAEASDVARLARSMQLAEQHIEAQRLRALSLSRLEDHANAIVAARLAARLALSHVAHWAIMQTHVTLGDVLAAGGRRGDALKAYATAALTTDSLSDSFNGFVDRARFRDQHLAAFDGALRILIARPGSSAWADTLRSWSARRKAARVTGVTTAAGTGSIRPVSAELASDEAVLDYIALDGRLWVLVVQRSTTRLIPLSTPLDSVARSIARLRAPLLATYGGQLDLARAPFNLRLAHGLYEVLVEPIVPFLEGTTRLSIVPDGVLHYVPFDALVVSEPSAVGARRYESARFMVDLFAITVTAPAFRKVRWRPFREPSSVLVLTRGVPGGAQEVAAIRQGWSGTVRTLSDMEATEQRLWTEAPAFSILHFATHAEANDHDPLASHLALAGDNENEGYLHLPEIERARWRGRLVILSACETANGPLLAGEGLMGLSRGFLAAGAEAVIATLWPIGPQSAEMMRPLYASLSRGSDAASALREAKLYVRRERRTAHPFYWAGFQLFIGGQESSRRRDARE